MDSQDEIFVQDLDRALQSGSPSNCKYLEDSEMELRLYEKDERDEIRTRIRARKLQYDRSDEQADWGSCKRVRRFFGSIKGFHQGSLDLTGRHEYRFRDLSEKWARMAPELLKIKQHTLIVETPVFGGDEEPIIDLDGTPWTTRECVVTPPELYDCFALTWRVRGTNLEYIFDSAIELLQCVSENPLPVFQKLLLQDLPTELHCQIMEVAGQHAARQLGSTCKYFHSISLSYIYQSRTLDMPFQLPDFEVRCTNASESELKEHIESQAKLSRSCLLEEFEFLFSRPDIINDIQWLSVFGEDFSHACDMLGYEAGSEEYDLFFAPLLTRASELLKRTVNVKTLLMKRLLISEDIAYAVLALSQLRVLKITHCEFLEETHLPLCASVLNVYLYMDQPQHVDSWKLIPSFPNLRFLTICGDSNLVDSLPGPDLFTACNPFRSLERLMLRGISPDDISTLVAWLHTSPDLRLTHFKIEAGEFGIVPIETLRLVGALARCPLQVLALIGIRYAEPPLVDIISEKFPALVALTLVFRDSPRQTRDKSTIWPCPTWEYAVLLGGFQHLEYFGWNMEVPQMPTDFSRTLKYLEEGFPDDDSWIFDVDSTWRDGDSQEDWYSVVRVLAAYSPSLQWVSFTNDPVGKYKVSRQPNGWINVKNEMSWEAFKTADKYSPHASGREWEFSNEST